MGRYRYKAAVPAVTTGTTTAQTLWPMLQLPIDNIAKRFAELEELMIGPAEAPSDLSIRLQLAVTSLANMPSGGTSMPDIGSGTAGVPLSLDPNVSRVSGVGDNASYRVEYQGGTPFGAAIATYARKPLITSFNHKYPLILTKQDLKDIVWGPNEALFVELAHESGSTAKIFNIDATWSE